MVAAVLAVVAVHGITILGVLLAGGHPDFLALALLDFRQLPWFMTFVRAIAWAKSFDHTPLAPTPFFWVGLVVLWTGDSFLSLSRGQHALVDVVVIALFVIDWWWKGPGKRDRKRLAATVLKARTVLARGIEAKRPIPA